MTTSSNARNPVEVLAEEFLDRKRRGEQPTLREYVEHYPELADDIRDLFPALLMMEDLGESSGGTTGSLAADNGAAVGVRLQRLGDYRILRQIGRGGMGVVYEAEQESLGRRVALKVLSASSLLDPKQVRRFEREAKAAAKLHHTNIVPVFGVGRQDGHHYFVMQFIAGLGLDVVLDDLRRLRGGKSEAKPAPAACRIASLTGADVARSLLTGRFDADGPPEDASVTESFDEAAPAANGPPADSGSSQVILPGSSELSASSDPDRQFYRSVARIGVQVAEALEYANRQGILHRDIKPSNLLLDNHGNVWVADFGLAKTAEADDLTHTGDILGTIRYMAPERFSGQCDARSDVYSLGLTLYELVALRPAYEAADRHSLMERVLHDEPDRLKKLAPGVPRDLETIIAKAIARDPAGRYTAAAALAEDLKRFVEDRPIRARRVSSPERLVRWCRRNPVVAGLLAAVFVLLATVAGVASVGYVQTRVALNREAEQRIAAVRQRQEADRQRQEADRQRQEADRQRALAEAAEARAKGEAGRASTAEQEMRRQWYAASSNLMQPAWDTTGQVSRLRALLAETEAYPDRGFEWYYWQRLCHLEQHALIGHRHEVTSVSWSPNGNRLATASWDGTAKIWDAAGGRELISLRYSGGLSSVAWSPDGTRLATGGRDGAARVWDAADGRELLVFKGHAGKVSWVAWSPDGTRLATASEDGTARVWDAAGGREPITLRGHTGPVYQVAWAPDGKRLASAGSDGTRIWDAAGGREPISLKGDSGKVWSVSWSPDGARLATASTDGARIWDAAGGREPITLRGHGWQVWSVAWAPDGKRLATASTEGTAKIWDAAGGRELHTLKGHTGAVQDVAWSPDGTRLATASDDGTARVWDAAGGGKPLAIEARTNVKVTIAWSPDGKRLATGSTDGGADLGRGRWP